MGGKKKAVNSDKKKLVDSSKEEPKQKSATKKKPTTTIQKTKKKVTRTQLFIHGSFMISVFGIVLLAGVWQQPRTWARRSTGNLLGEAFLESPERAQQFADSSMAEASSIWAEPSSNWQTMHNTTTTTTAAATSKSPNNPLAVECRTITEGPLSAALIHMGRAEGILRGVTAEEAYDFMTSPEGLAMLVPSSTASDFETSIETIPEWRDGQARAEIGEFSIPSLAYFWKERTFVVLKSYLPVERLFVAKSVVHKSRAGASALFEDGKITDSRWGAKQVRAVTTFALQTETKTLVPGGEEVVNVKMISYTNGFYQETLTSYWTCSLFFPIVYEKFQKALDARKSI